MIGIYKITSPNGRIYIGQSWNIKRRWKDYRNDNRERSAIYSSIKKYGYENHHFEIIHQLPNDVEQCVMDEYEILYILLHRQSGFKMLNLREGGKSGGKMSDEAKKKMVIANTGRKMSEKTKVALKKANCGRKMPEHLKEIFSKIRTTENAQRMGYMNRGKVRTNENKSQISQTLKNRIDNKGEFNSHSKLTNAVVIEIRSKYKPNEYTTTDIARDYGMSKTNAKDIIAKRSWTHI